MGLLLRRSVVLGFLALQTAGMVDRRAWVWGRRVQVAVIWHGDGRAERGDLSKEVMLSEIAGLRECRILGGAITGKVITLGGRRWGLGHRVLPQYVLGQELAKRHNLLSPVLIRVAPPYLHRHESSALECLPHPVGIPSPLVQGWPVIQYPSQDDRLLDVVHVFLEEG